MKKSLLLVSLLAVALVACGKKEEAPAASTPAVEAAPASVAAPASAPAVEAAPASAAAMPASVPTEAAPAAASAAASK